MIKRLQTQSSASPTVSLGTSTELLVGAAAGGLAQIFTIPVSVIATRQQVWTPSIPGGKEKTPSLLETGQEIVQEGGVTGLWTGLKPGLVLTINPAITYGVFERLKSALLARPGRTTERLGAMENFWLGVGVKPSLRSSHTLTSLYVSPLQATLCNSS